MGKITCHDAFGNHLNCFYQWDSNRVIVISGVETNMVNEVHFCTIDSDTAIVVTPRISGNEIVASVPNVLLRQTKPIIIYIFSSSDTSENRTIEVARIVVVSRPKPANYIYSETEVFSYAAIDRRVRAIEQSQSEAVRSVNGCVPDENGNVEIQAAWLDEAMAIEDLALTGIVEPVADENNAVLVDENNCIYIF